ncbi:MAG: TspO/MBR family protein [Phycisphaerales bacterium]|nr:TspO/MBR family protein [Phycisphaerales bacterium]
MPTAKPTHPPHPGSMLRQTLALLGWLTFTFLAAAGAVFTDSGQGVWYAALNKPSWQPPPAVFGPVWTTLYIVMAVAAWRVWRTPKRTPGRTGALTVFAVQWVLNAAWTPLFFGAHLIGVALVDIVLLVAALTATVVFFSRVDRSAAWLMLPTLAWVVFATVLNFVLWRLNG